MDDSDAQELEFEYDGYDDSGDEEIHHSESLTYELQSTSFEEVDNDAEELSKYESLTKEQLMILLEAEFARLSEVLDKDLWSISVLLRHYRWKVDTILADYIDDPERVCRKAGLSLSDDFAVHALENHRCGICLDVVPRAVGMKCEHYFCQECWRDYFSFKIHSEGVSCTRIYCAQPGCSLLISDNFVKQIVPTPTYQKLREFFFQSLVDDNPTIRWCIRPGCDKIIRKAETSFFSMARCDCGQRMCFKCGEDGHTPIDCAVMKAWMVKCKDDSETHSWLLVNTKPCPQCLCPIDKNGGCNHMTCEKCKYEFCWVCTENWKVHGTQYYQCNRYDPKSQDAASKDASKRSLEKYLHYYVRFMNHANSLKLEQKTTAAIEAKIAALIRDGQSSWIDLDYLSIASKQLTDVRQIFFFIFFLFINLKFQFPIVILIQIWLVLSLAFSRRCSFFSLAIMC
eukprot:TRINITY_DN5514_c0_g1_i2.p1 TRINITY_DN5514_c0_g1~~TRINITY_DN5514_c0_g1_i2.p1  ORF type:complete len:455 (-),score=69.08 TRINITY_DN5514_c0_g1_i2:562-1926(-)